MQFLLTYLFTSIVVISSSYLVKKSRRHSRYTNWMWWKVYDNKHIMTPDEGDLFFALTKHAFRLFFYVGFLFSGPIFVLPLIGDIVSVFIKKRLHWAPGDKPSLQPFTADEIAKRFPGMANRQSLRPIPD